MRDIHTGRPNAGPVPILSPVIHCIAMTVLVFLRRDFGYAFLRPKSIFFAFSWAFALFVIVSWNEVELWQKYRLLCCFGVGATILYWLHFLGTFWRDLNQRGASDHYSGRSNLVDIIAIFGGSSDRVGWHFHLWIEPATVALVGLILSNNPQGAVLSRWLYIAAGSLAAAEFLNFWSGTIRREKVARDITNDTEAQSERLNDTRETAVPKATRKEPIKMPRTRTRNDS